MKLRSIIAGALVSAAACTPMHTKMLEPRPIYVSYSPIHDDCFVGYHGNQRISCYDGLNGSFIQLRFGLYSNPRLIIRHEPNRLYQPQLPRAEQPRYKPRPELPRQSHYPEYRRPEPTSNHPEYRRPETRQERGSSNPQKHPLPPRRP